MDEPAKNSIWNYLIPLWQLEQVSSIFGRRGVEVSLTSHYYESQAILNTVSRKNNVVYFSSLAIIGEICSRIMKMEISLHRGSF